MQMHFTQSHRYSPDGFSMAYAKSNEVKEVPSMMARNLYAQGIAIPADKTEEIASVYEARRLDVIRQTVGARLLREGKLTMSHFTNFGRFDQKLKSDWHLERYYPAEFKLIQSEMEA